MNRPDWNIALPRPVQLAIDRLEAAGYQAWLTGGALRDLLRGQLPQDYDLTSAAPPEQIRQMFADCPLDQTGAVYGVTTVFLEGMALEIAAFRKEGDYQDGRRPGFVEPAASVEEDLARRDFTVNAMAYSPCRGLTDPWGGLADLNDRLIRTVGLPDRRFQEDGLRLLRALRFAAALDFEIEPETAQAIRRQTEMLRHISAPRAGQELGKLLCGPGAARVLDQFPGSAAWALPQLAQQMENPTQRRHTLEALAQAPPNLAVRLAIALSASGNAAAAQALTRLGFSAALRDQVCQLIVWQGKELPQSEAGLRRLLRALGPEQTNRLLDLQKARNPKSEAVSQARQSLTRILAREDCYDLPALAVRGRDLQALGLEGPAIGQTLAWLLDQAIERPELNRRESLLALAKQRKDGTHAGKQV